MTKHIYHVIFALIILVAGVLPVSSYAQTAESPRDQGAIPTDADLISGAPLVADVFVYEVSTTTNEQGKNSAGFSILGRMGQENDLTYGVVVLGETGELLETIPAGSLRSLADGQAQHINFIWPAKWSSGWW
jgi:hypothetical protein